jgi:ArsR family transcriptional regulator
VQTPLELRTAGSCCGLAAAPMDAEEAERVAPMFKALGDPVRLRLAAMIAAQDEICVCDLTPNFDVSGPTISHHLRILREAGLVDCERRGTWVHYWIQPQALQSLSALLQVTA